MTGRPLHSFMLLLLNILNTRSMVENFNLKNYIQLCRRYALILMLGGFELLDIYFSLKDIRNGYENGSCDKCLRKYETYQTNTEIENEV